MKKFPPRLRPVLALLVAPFCLVSTGCQKQSAATSDSEYGSSRGTSINGTGVFYELLAGFSNQMARASFLGPMLMERADVIVYFQRAPEGVSRELDLWFQAWLNAGPDRVLLFVGRDFDASLHFWHDVLHPMEATTNDVRVSPKAKLKYEEALLELTDLSASTIGPNHNRYSFVTEKQVDPAVVNAEAEATLPLAPVATRGARLFLRHHPNPDPRGKIEIGSKPVAGDVSNSEPHNVSTSRFTSSISRFRAPGPTRAEDAIEPAQVLLRVQAAPMVVSKQVGRGKAIIVANGSFLLNYSLINHEHRVLAANLAGQLGASRRIWFLEGAAMSSSGTQGLKFPNPLAFLFVPPINWVVIHWLLVGVVYLLYKSPIFGRPRCPAESQLHRFSSHIKAYAKLLQQTGDKDYALTQIENYRANLKRGG